MRQTGKLHHILIPDNGGWSSSSHWHTGMTQSPSAGSWRLLSFRRLYKPIERGPAAIPQITVLQQSPSRGAITAPSPPPPPDTHPRKKNLCPIFMLSSCMECSTVAKECREGEAVLLRGCWSWQPQAWHHAEWFCANRVSWRMIPDLWGHYVLWPMGGECACH